MNVRSFRYFFHKLANWEYWPQQLVYAPVIPLYLYYTAKAGTPFFNVAANPTMENGGYMMESKFTILQQLPRRLVPDTIKITAGTPIEEVKNQMQEHRFSFPCFCKPDIGGKGLGVAKIDNEDQLLNYQQGCRTDYLVQAEIPFKNEIGVFYCRLPYQPSGKITGIVGKKYLEVTGDGKSTLKELIECNPRYYFQRKQLFSKYGSQFDEIIPEGQKLVLSDIGNHARGSEFVDLTHLNNPRLETLIDGISREYNTLYYGRYDIKFNDWEELCEGKNFMIIELNGCGSEPTHIYDTRIKLRGALKIIVRHWKLMYSIAAYNHKMGAPYLSLREGRRLQKEEKKIKDSFHWLT